MYDIIIIGGGAAGLTAGLYAGRGGLKALIIEKMFVGGQAATTYEVDNYPGFSERISGPDLMMKMEAHAKKFGTEIVYEDVIEVDVEGIKKTVKTNKNTYQAKALILAMGANPKELGLEKERKFRGAGVSYCATCDGAFYRDKVVAVVGGGDTAVEDALFLSRFCPKVYLIHRRDSLRAVKVLQDAAMANDKIEFIWNTTIEKILGEESVEGITIKNVKTNEVKDLNVDGLFIAIGVVPNSDLVKGKVETNEAGYIITDENMQTNKFGVFAAGDIREKILRQIVTAAADGAIATYAAERYINENRW
ncbi:thioredoxin-disulfide reductase [Petroclostridium xylanilyticum]|uniref:thioredoxin-disulfide reductase n=1 Tax=Petroclostridium xylanilyticum TaxID=1792311 RepID=UPI000B9877F4|nr:thioredoxin-disulfide reductase [Petroclostridium xylanilyticum]